MRTTAPTSILWLVAASAMAGEPTLPPLAARANVEASPSIAGPSEREVSARASTLPAQLTAVRPAEPFPLLTPESSYRARQLEDWGPVPAQRQVTLRIVLRRTSRDHASGKGKP